MRANISKIIRIIWGLGFFVAGCLHWLSILGVYSEKTPLLISVYFDSLAVLNFVVAWGFWVNIAWAIKLGLGIMILQLPAHGYMIYLDELSSYGSGISTASRLIDIFFAVLYIGCYYLWSMDTSDRKCR